MITVDEHLRACLAAVGPLPPETVALAAARGRVLAADVASAVSLPAFDNSAMDGFAVRAPELAGSLPASLPISGESAAGGPPPTPLAPGTVIRIMTGAPLPAGADAVVPVEWTTGWDDRAQVTVGKAPDAGAYVRRAGEDVEAGEVVLAAGTPLTARHVALLAAVGRAEVEVHRRPRVAVFSSGSELVPPGRPLGPGQIYESNGHGLAAAAEALGATVRWLGIVPDDAAAVRAALHDAAADSDLVLTSGGVSAGVYDTVKEVLTEVGTVRFEKVAMQPGMPQGFGTVDGTPIFTLPGNPVSSMVSFEVFVRPVLHVLAGVRAAAVSMPPVLGVAAASWRSPEGKQQYVRAVLEPPPDLLHPPAAGTPAVRDLRPRVRPVGAQGSHLVADLAGATHLAVVPAVQLVVGAGDELLCLPLSEVPWT